MKDLPIGIQTFADIITNGYLYVDKTQYLYNLVRPGKGAYFLARPRRFGKSLTISTLDAIFQGKKKLFVGLYIKEKTNYAWKTYPIIRIDMSQIKNNSQEIFITELKKQLEILANKYKIKIDFSQSESKIFQDLIRLLYEKSGKQVVILIDEYDKPIIDHLGEKQALINRDILRGFYGTCKSQDQYIRLIFVTGISKFAKVSMFSEWNNLIDISTEAPFSTMFGLTKEEMDSYFAERIEEIAKQKNMAVNQLKNEIKEWYNGYRFSKAEKYVHNPVSVMNYLRTGEFENYWFQTGTSKMLVDYIKKQRDITLQKFNELIVPQDVFDVLDIERPTLEALMFQTGYLTIKNIEGPITNVMYTLGYPNQEVEKSFVEYLADGFTSDHKISTKVGHMAQLLTAGRIEEFLQQLKILFAGISYEIQPTEKDKEYYYNSMMYLVFRLLGMAAGAKERTNKGRIDTVVETKDQIYIIEYKLNKTAQDAIKQIKEKQYCEKYQDRGKKITLIGINFSATERNITDWKIETI